MKPMPDYPPNHSDRRVSQNAPIHADDTVEWPWDAATHTQLCTALLIADDVADVLRAVLQVILPTGVTGVGFLLLGGPPDEGHLELSAEWSHDGQPLFVSGAKFSVEDQLFTPLFVGRQSVAVHDLVNDERAGKYARAILLQADVRWLVSVSLRSDGNCFGLLLLTQSGSDLFAPEHLIAYKALADLTEATIAKLWLIREHQRALDQASALYTIGRHLLQAQDINEILQRVVDSQLFGAASGTIALLEDATSDAGWEVQDLVFWAAAGDAAEAILDMRLPATEGVIGWVVRHNQAALVPDAYSDERFYSKMDRDIDYRTHSILCAPLRVEDGVIGAIELVDVRPEYLCEAGINLLSQVADQAALLIQNQRLLHENQSLLAQSNQALQETTLLYEAGRAITRAQDMQGVLRAITEHLPDQQLDQCWMAALEASAFNIRDSGTTVAEIKAVWDIHGDVSLLNRRFTSRDLPFLAQDKVGAIFVANDLDNESELDTRSAKTLRDLGAKSAIILPLAVGELPIGWLVLIAQQSNLVFDPAQQRTFQMLADQAAVAIRNQQLLKQVQDSLREVEAVHRQYLRDEWTNFLRARQDRALAVAYERGTVRHTQDLSHPLIEKSVRQSDVVTEPNNGNSSHADDVADIEGGVALVAPLKVRGQVIGTLGLEDPEESHRWTDDQISLIQEIADRVAQTIENARLLEETQTSLAETEHLYEATGRFSDADTPQKVLEILAQEFRTALGPDFSGSILRAGPKPANRIEWLEERAHWNSTGTVLLQGGRFATARYLTLERLVRQRDPVIVEDNALIPEAIFPQELLGYSQRPSLLAIPLVVGDSWLGIITVVCPSGKTLASRTMRFLESLADRAAVALEGARLYDETRRRAIQLEAGAKISRAATSILEQDNLLSSVVALIGDHFEYDRVQVFLLDPTGTWAVLEASTDETGERLLASGHAVEVGGAALVGKVTATGEARYSFEGPRRGESAERELSEVRAELVIPLQIGGRIIGALDVHGSEPSVFSPDDLGVLSTLADQLAVAIENARLYQEQLKTAEKLREADRIKSQFLANMSHELRTPLNSIIGFSRVILKGIDGPLTDLQKQDLTAIHNSGKLLLTLINDVLDISKIAAGKMELAFEELDLSEVIEGVLSTTAALLKDKPQLELVTNIRNDVPSIVADATRLRQVLLNLLSNAVKFTQAGCIALSVTYDSDYITIEVRDTGIGIASDKFDLIFQEFEQVDGSATRAVGGTGLGLPISRHFVEMHGGRIWVESQVGVGSTFSVQLPIQGPQDVFEAEREVIDPGRRLILAVDDDIEVIQLYKRYLERKEYQVIGLSASEKALDKARELCPHVILLDVLMPNKDGWAVIRELKSDPVVRDIPVIMCSIVGASRRGFSLGAADFLIKPVDEERLLRALKRLDDHADNNPSKGRRVLIIDDSPDDRNLLRRTLQSAREPYHVMEAGNGLEGIEAIHKAKPDLVILDLVMPEMDGFAVVEALKSNSDMRQIPIIIVTGMELAPQERAQITGQVAALFRKGLFDEEEFFEDIARALQKLRRTTSAADKERNL
jgi:signal transduction histidine kinase/CheY-like chemotaxis protein